MIRALLEENGTLRCQIALRHDFAVFTQKENQKQQQSGKAAARDFGT
jgi:hypothetical protein